MRLSLGPVWIVGALVIAFVGMASLNQSDSTYYLEVAASSLAFAVPWMAVFYAVSRPARLLRYLQVASVIIILAGLARLYLPSQRLGSAVEYSQYDGYQVLPAAVIFTDSFVRKPRILSAFLVITAVVLLLAAGARGPLLALVLYVVARGIVALRRRPPVALFVTAIASAVVWWFDRIILAIANALEQLFIVSGFSTRTLHRLIQGSFLEDRARGSLATYSIRLILDNPVAGVGVARDRLLLAEAMGIRDPSIAVKWYPHNLVLELLLQFGVFVGGGLLVAIAILVVRAALNVIETPMSSVVLIFVGIGLAPLMVSGSYLTSPLFFALLGLCLTARRRRLMAGAGLKRDELGASAVRQ